MLAYIVRRILAMLPIMGVVVVFVFLLVRIAPETRRIIAGITPRRGHPEDPRRPGPRQTDPYPVRAVRGSLIRGTSPVPPFRRPVSQLIAQRIEPTLAWPEHAPFAVLTAIPLESCRLAAGSLVDRR